MTLVWVDEPLRQKVEAAGSTPWDLPIALAGIRKATSAFEGSCRSGLNHRLQMDDTSEVIAVTR